MGDKQTVSKTTLSFPNVKVSSMNDDGEAVIKFAFKVNVLCEYDPEVRNIQLGAPLKCR
jgi:hypothetical protein